MKQTKTNKTDRANQKIKTEKYFNFFACGSLIETFCWDQLGSSFYIGMGWQYFYSHGQAYYSLIGDNLVAKWEN